jgi:MFS family permease
MSPAQGTARPGLVAALAPLVGGQICIHASMAGLRLAAPLWALKQDYSAWTVGVLLALFAAAPIATALHAGRLADRHGYHRPMSIAVGLTVAGALLACMAEAGGELWPLDASLHFIFIALCIAAVLSGAGANCGLIAIQRTAGRTAAAEAAASGDEPGTALKRVFSWLGLAPSVANMLGAFAAGVLIDTTGFAGAFGVLAVLPLGALLWSRRVPREADEVRAAARAKPRRPLWGSAVELSATPGLRRLLFVNWLLSTSWDVHSFLVPILGHTRGLSATAIGTILAVFAASVSAVRLLIPLIAHRMREAQVLAGSMLVVAAVFALYPLALNAWTMGACAVVLGVALGTVQPMIMSTLHQMTPHERHGEAIALRSMTINLSSTVMPLGFGLAGTLIGATGLFWVLAGMVGAGSMAARRLHTSRAA